MHARTIGIENTCHFDAQFVLAPIIKEQSFRAALSLIVTGANSNGVDASPVVLCLWMHIWIAVHFRGRCLQDFGLNSLGKAEHVNGAVHAGLRRLHWVMLVMDGGCWASKIVNLIDFQIDWECYVVANELKTLVLEQMLDVASRASEKIIEA